MDKPVPGRRQFLIGTAVVAGTGFAGALGAKIHDGELGAPPRTYGGGVPWTEGHADAPPGVSGTDYKFFIPAERVFI